MKKYTELQKAMSLVALIITASIASGCAALNVAALPDGELPKTLEQCQDVFIDRNDQIYLLKLEVKQLKEELDANSRK